MNSSSLDEKIKTLTILPEQITEEINRINATNSKLWTPEVDRYRTTLAIVHTILNQIGINRNTIEFFEYGAQHQRISHGISLYNSVIAQFLLLTDQPFTYHAFDIHFTEQELRKDVEHITKTSSVYDADYEYAMRLIHHKKVSGLFSTHYDVSPEDIAKKLQLANESSFSQLKEKINYAIQQGKLPIHFSNNVFQDSKNHLFTFLPGIHIHTGIGHEVYDFITTLSPEKKPPPLEQLTQLHDEQSGFQYYDQKQITQEVHKALFFTKGIINGASLTAGILNNIFWSVYYNPREKETSEEREVMSQDYYIECKQELKLL